MILKKIPCADPTRVAEYLFGPGRKRIPGRAERVAGTILGRDPKSLSKELMAIWKLRPDVSHPFIHIAISLHVDDRKLSEDEVTALGQELARVLDVSFWELIFHSDSPHNPHWHFIASRIGFGGRLSREHLRDYRLHEQFARRCERWFALKEVASPIRPGPEHPYGRSTGPKRPTRAESEARDHGRPLARDRLKTAIDLALSKGYRDQALLDFLRGRGFTSRITYKRGMPSGIAWVVHPEGLRIRGSSLGAGYSGKTFFIKGGFNAQPHSKPSHSFRCTRRTQVHLHIRPYNHQRAWARILRDLRREQNRPRPGRWNTLFRWACRSLRVSNQDFPRPWR